MLYVDTVPSIKVIANRTWSHFGLSKGSKIVTNRRWEALTNNI